MEGDRVFRIICGDSPQRVLFAWAFWRRGELMWMDQKAWEGNGAGTSMMAERVPSLPRSSRSRHTSTPARLAPLASMMALDSRIAVPAVMTSSTVRIRPCSARQ